MNSSDSYEDSYQKDSLLDIFSCRTKDQVFNSEKLSIDFSNQIQSVGKFHKPKQIYIQNTNHTKEMHVSIIKDQRSISLFCSLNILRKGTQQQNNGSSRKIKVNNLDDLQYEAKVIRIKNIVRRKSCSCKNCGQQSEFEKRVNTFTVKTQQLINTELKLLKFNSRSQFKQQSLIRIHKLKQIQNKFHVSSLSSQIENNINEIQVEVLPIIDKNKQEIKKKIIQQPVILRQYLPTTKNYYVKQYHISPRRIYNNTPTQKTLPSLQTFTQSRRNLFEKQY